MRLACSGRRYVHTHGPGISHIVLNHGTDQLDIALSCCSWFWLDVIILGASRTMAYTPGVAVLKMPGTSINVMWRC